MTQIVTQIPASNIVPDVSVKKLQVPTSQQSTTSLFKTELTQPSILFSSQGIKLIQSQVSKLEGNTQHKKRQKTDSPVASSLLPFLLKEFHKSIKSESSITGQQTPDPLEAKDNSPESKIQALNELIDDFDIEADADFMDLSRWIMKANNEMSVDDYD